MSRSYPPEFRDKALDLVAPGRSVADVAEALGVSGQTVYDWPAQDRIDLGQEPGLTSIERAENAQGGGLFRPTDGRLG